MVNGVHYLVLGHRQDGPAGGGVDVCWSDGFTLGSGLRWCCEGRLERHNPAIIAVRPGCGQNGWMGRWMDGWAYRWWWVVSLAPCLGAGWMDRPTKRSGPSDRLNACLAGPMRTHSPQHCCSAAAGPTTSSHPPTACASPRRP